MIHKYHSYIVGDHGDCHLEAIFIICHVFNSADYAASLAHLSSRLFIFVIDDVGNNDDDGDDNNNYMIDLKLKILIPIKLYISEFQF